MARIAALRRPLRAAWNKAPRSLKKAREAVQMATGADAQTFYPEAERKGKLSILAEQLFFLLRDGDIEKFYFHYGRDRKAISPSGVMTRAQFFRRRDGRNLGTGPDGGSYACVPRDKHLFSLVAEALGHPVPRRLGVLSPSGIVWAGRHASEPLDAVLSRDFDGFCKPLTGIGGWGALCVSVRQGKVVLNGAPATIADLRSLLDKPCILQERVVPHPAYARLNPDSLNTLRIVTELRDGDVSPLHVHVRMGRAGGITDNISRGGVVLELDPATGRAQGDGVVWSSRERWVKEHPDTGVRFEDLVLPSVPEAVAVACRFHGDLPYFHTLGWDLAVTPEGVVVIETNERWGGGLASISAPEYTPAFWARSEATPPPG